MRLSVRTAQVLILLLVLLLTTVFVGGSATLNATFAVEDLGGQWLDQAAARVSQHVDAVLASAVDEGETFRMLLERGAVDARRKVELSNLFLAALEARESLSYLSLGLETGDYVEASRCGAGCLSIQWLDRNGDGGMDRVELTPQPNGTLVESQRDVDTKRPPPATRPYYVAAAQTGKPMWPDTYLFLGPSGEPDIPGVTRAVPVKDADGELVGVLTADFDLFALSRYLERIRLGDEGFAFLLELRQDGGRRVIAHPDAPDRLRLVQAGSKDEGQEALPAEAVTDDRVQGFLGQLPRRGGAFSKKLTPVRFDAEGRRWMGGYRLLEGADRPSWVIALLVPEDEVLGRVNAMKRTTAWIALGGVLFVLGLAYLISAAVSKKLRHLAEQTRRIADFRLEAEPPERSRVAELDRLGVAVEEMKSGLRSFQKYVPAELVRSILASGQEARLGATERRISVYFSDVVGFTSIAESLSPQDLTDMLAAYLGAMTHEMLDAGATVDKYIGDAIMAFWGAPQDHPDPAWAACRTALGNQRALARLRAQWAQSGLPEFRARIGLNLGEARVGNFGSENRLDYTAIGDTVNLAARLEALNKTYGTYILMSEAIHAEVSDRVVARRVDRVAVKGRSRGTLVYELVGLPEEVPAETKRLVEAYEGALDLYFDRQFQAALDAFWAVRQIRDDDGPTAILIQRAERYLRQAPPNDWTGVFAMTSK